MAMIIRSSPGLVPPPAPDDDEGWRDAAGIVWRSAQAMCFDLFYARGECPPGFTLVNVPADGMLTLHTLVPEGITKDEATWVVKRHARKLNAVICVWWAEMWMLADQATPPKGTIRNHPDRTEGIYIVLESTHIALPDRAAYAEIVRSGNRPPALKPWKNREYAYTEGTFTHLLTPPPTPSEA